MRKRKEKKKERGKAAKFSLTVSCRLGEIYKKQGLKIRGKQQTFKDEHTTTNEIWFRISDVTGFARTTIGSYLDPKYKQEARGGTTEPKLAASVRILHELGKDYVERHREEILAEEATFTLTDLFFLHLALYNVFLEPKTAVMKTRRNTLDSNNAVERTSM